METMLQGVPGLKDKKTEVLGRNWVNLRGGGAGIFVIGRMR